MKKNNIIDSIKNIINNIKKFFIKKHYFPVTEQENYNSLNETNNKLEQHKTNKFKEELKRFYT